MQIGHKIYYYKATGIVIVDKGEMQGDVRETTFEEDKLAYSQLTDYTEETIGVLQLSYGERADEFNNAGSMQVIDDVLVIYPKLVVTIDKPEIIANGIDSATITATIVDTIGTHAITFTVDDGEPITINTVNGIALFSITTTITGEYKIKTSSDLYGTSINTIKGV